MSLSVVVFLAFAGLVSAQDQCNPDEYEECGGYVKTLGYADTCTNQVQCRDCIGCNQACAFFPCSPAITCTTAEYTTAGNYIQSKQDELGWLNLCCEASAPAAKKCVGCQQANIFNILCGWVYPPLKMALGYAAQGVPPNADNLYPDPWSGIKGDQNENSMRFLGDDQHDTLLFGVQYMGIGAIIGILLTLIPIAVIYCVCKQTVRYTHKYKKVSCLDSEDDAQRV